jgi:hypothetical protein
MRAPPAISIDIAAPPGWRIAQALLHTAAAASLAAWVGTHVDAPDVVVPAAAIAAAAGAAIGWYLSQAQPAWLAWTGGEWQLRVGPAALKLAPGSAPQPMVDCYGFMLLRVATNAGKNHWLALTRGIVGAAWQPLRAAVYSSASQQRFRSPAERPPF